MKKLRGWKREKEFDTTTIATDITQLPKAVSEETKETIDRKSLGEAEIKITIGQKTQVYEPRPLTPDDDIYEDIIEQFASAPTKPKYWFEEFGDYWSCSCGHINKGDYCKSCGLSRELLRSLFILHKPGYATSKLDKKVKRAQKKVDQEEQQYLEKESRRKKREASGEDLTIVTPIEPAPAFHAPIENEDIREAKNDDLQQATQGNKQQENAQQTEQGSRRQENTQQTGNGEVQQTAQDNAQDGKALTDHAQQAQKSESLHAQPSAIRKTRTGQIGIKLTRDEPNSAAQTTSNETLQDEANTTGSGQSNAQNTQQNSGKSAYGTQTATALLNPNGKQTEGGTKQTESDDAQTATEPSGSTYANSESNGTEQQTDQPLPKNSKRTENRTSPAGTGFESGRSDTAALPANTRPQQTNAAKKTPAKIKFTEINVAEAANSGKPSKKKRTIIIAAIAICLILIAICGYMIYIHMAAPAMKYEEAQELQAAGKYQKAIEKYESLADYKDSQEKIWQCYISMGDDQYANGKYEKAIKTYQKALKLKKSKKINEKIRNCYIAIGDRQYESGEYENALKTYISVVEMGDSDELQEKINAAKFAYVKAFQADRTSQVEQYMAELMTLKYPGIQEIYDAYYAWHVKILANTSETDYSTDIDTASRKDTVYFHALISGGEPNESVELYYEIAWPNGSKQIYGLDSRWQDGSKITARFQYPIPLFGKEGKLTFTLYDKSTNEVMGSDSITFQN